MVAVNLSPTRPARAVDERATVGAPGDALIDRFGRVHRDLRISLTDRCSLRCTYCMPEQGNEWLARSGLMTADEIVRRLALDHVADLRRRVWGAPVGVGWPRGLAFGAQALGFLGDDREAVLWRTGPWWRLSTERGHVLAR